MTYTVKGDRLFRGGTPVAHRTTRKKSNGRMNPSVLIVHYTASDDFDRDVAVLSIGERQVSAHLILGQSGELVQVEDFRTRLWHAGKSQWRGRSRLNSHAIGLEVTCIGWLDRLDNGRYGRDGTEVMDGKTHDIVEGRHPNGGPVRGWRRFTPAQMRVLSELVPVLVAAYGLEVVGHDMVSPGRKQDPGLCIDRLWLDHWNGRGEAPPLEASPSGKPRREEAVAAPAGRIDLATMRRTHSAFGGRAWRLSHAGVEVSGSVPRTKGEPATVRRIWRTWRAPIMEASDRYGVPADLIVACIATETKGDPGARRREPGFRSDEKTPDRVSYGLTQPLLSTAQWLMDDPSIGRGWLLDPGHNLKVCAAYIAWQAEHKGTGFDPVKVLAAYNSGGLYETNRNPWHLRTRAGHIDRGIAWFNDCHAAWAADDGAPTNSLYVLLNAVGAGGPAMGEPVRRGVLRAFLDLLRWIVKGR